MKRYILLVFCILLGFVYFFIPLAYVERFVGNDGVYGFGRYIEISNAKGDAVVLEMTNIHGIQGFSGCCVVPARFRKRRKLCRSVRLRFVECRVFYSLFDT